jgi:hypothetical protein
MPGRDRIALPARWDCLRLLGEVAVKGQATRNFTNNILWQLNPDSALLHEHFHNQRETEVRSLALYAGMSAGVMMTSDDLGDLGAERVRLWKLILNPERRTCRFPLLGQTTTSYATRTDLVTGQQTLKLFPNTQCWYRCATCGVALFFNIGEGIVQRTYPLRRLDLVGPLYVFDWRVNQAWPEAVEALPARLAPHDSALLFLADKKIENAPERLM